MVRATNDFIVNSGFPLECCFSSLDECVGLQEICLVPASLGLNHTVGSEHTSCMWTWAVVPLFPAAFDTACAASL